MSQDDTSQSLTAAENADQADVQQDSAPQDDTAQIGGGPDAAQPKKDAQGMEGSNTTHRMSIALTIGATIGLIGLILFLYGLFGNADYSRSGGLNINLWWGALMLVFGILLGGGSYLSARRHTTAS